MADIRLVDMNGSFTEHVYDRDRLDRRPSNLAEAWRNFARPHGHDILFTKRGYLVVQERALEKRHHPGRLYPFHGGHISNKDFLDAEGNDVWAAYRIGTRREVKQEISISVPNEDLFSVTGKYMPRREVELDYNVYLRMFATIYNRDKHGPIRVNLGEAHSVEYMTVKDVEKEKLFEGALEDRFGQRLLNFCYETADKIRARGPDEVLKEWRKEREPIVLSPEDRLLEAAPEALQAIRDAPPENSTWLDRLAVYIAGFKTIWRRPPKL